MYDLILIENLTKHTHEYVFGTIFFEQVSLIVASVFSLKSYLYHINLTQQTDFKIDRKSGTVTIQLDNYHIVLCDGYQHFASQVINHLHQGALSTCAS